jgi:hypothetical protein
MELLLQAIDTAARRDKEYPGNVMSENIQAIKRLADNLREENLDNLQGKKPFCDMRFFAGGEGFCRDTRWHSKSCNSAGAAPCRNVSDEAEG